MPHNLDNPPQEFRRRVDDQYKCECGLPFRTYADWEKHRAKERRKEKESQETSA
jgi:hypothetical protein